MINKSMKIKFVTNLLYQIQLTFSMLPYVRNEINDFANENYGQDLN